MKHILIIGLTTVALATAAFAQNMIEVRQEAMEGQGKNMKALSGMASGKTEFDAAIAETALAGLAASAQTLHDLFPEDSQTGIGHEGHETEAAPAIWEKPDEFAALVDKFITDTAAAVAAAPQSAEELAAVMGPIGGGCKSCHENFRIEKE